MIGFIVTKEQSAFILEAIKQAQLSRDVPHYWSTGSYQIFSGINSGKYFIPFDNEMSQTILRTGQRPIDYPEFITLVSYLGGLDARVDLNYLEIQSIE